MLSSVPLDSTALAVVGLFLLVTLALGLYAGRNVKDFRDYALGGRRFSTFALVLTFLASNIGGGTIIGLTNSVYKIGVIGGITLILTSLQYLFFYYILGPNIIKFKNCYTIGDLIFQLFGKKLQFLSGILIALNMIFKGVSQIVAVGLLYSNLFNIEFSSVVIFSTLTVALYVCFGGIKSVIATDVLQFLIFYIIFPLIASYLLYKCGGFRGVISKIPPSHLSIFKVENFYQQLSLVFIFTFLPMTLLNQADMQRIFIAKNKQQVKNMFLSISVIYPIFITIIIIIGLAGKIVFNDNTHSSLVYKIILQSPNFIKYSLILGISSVILSSADSFFNSAGIVLYNDILKNINLEFSKKPLFWVRVSTFFVIVLSALFSMNSKNILKWHFKEQNYRGPYYCSQF